METKAVEAVVDWWADKLRSCKNSGLSEAERRDPENDGYSLATLLMTATRPHVSDEQIIKFRESLRDQLVASEPHCLSVDYGPDSVLSQALIAAGVEGKMGTLPIKTTMWIDKKEVRVRYGYGAPVETIYPR